MSSIHLKPFEYFEPAKVTEAANLLNNYGGNDLVGATNSATAIFYCTCGSAFIF